MMILSLLPPVWFYVMNKRIAALHDENQSDRINAPVTA
jgi:hypothetical protein